MLKADSLSPQCDDGYAAMCNACSLNYGYWFDKLQSNLQQIWLQNRRIDRQLWQFRTSGSDKNSAMGNSKINIVVPYAVTLHCI